MVVPTERPPLGVFVPCLEPVRRKSVGRHRFFYDGFVHTTSFRVRFGELDPYSHVNHAVYVAWFEAGRGDALEAIGMSLKHMADLGWQMVVTDLKVKFRRPAMAGDTVTIETWIDEIGGATSTWMQRARRGDEVLCESEVRAGSTDLSGKPIRTSKEVREALRALLATAETPTADAPATAE